MFARGHSILGQATYTRPAEINQPVTITAHPPTIETYNSLFPALTIRALDVIVADEDGVVVIRPEHVNDVLEACKTNKEVEAKCMKDLQAGRSVGDTLKEHRGASGASAQQKSEDKKEDTKEDKKEDKKE